MAATRAGAMGTSNSPVTGSAAAAQIACSSAALWLMSPCVRVTMASSSRITFPASSCGGAGWFSSVSVTSRRRFGLGEAGSRARTTPT
jgi:hypothetical protein